MKFTRIGSGPLGLIAVLACVACSPRPPTEPTQRTTSAVSVPSTPCLLNAPFNAPVPAFTGTISADGLSFSTDGLTAYLSSKMSGNYDIYVATRMTVDQPFGALAPLAVVNSPADERAPFISPDGLKLYMSKTNGGSLDIAVATRNDPSLPFGAAQFIPGMNSNVADQDPFFLASTQQLFFSSERPNGAQREFYVSNLSGGTFSPPAMLTGPVNSPDFEDTRPILSPDGLTIYFASTRWGIGGDTSGDIFMAQRSSTSAQFGTPTNLMAFNNSGIEFPVAISANGCTLYFASNEDTGLGASQQFRLYQATHASTIPSLVTVNLNIIGFGSVTTPPFNCSTGNVGTCSAQGAPGGSVTVLASGLSMWTGSCAPNGGLLSTDGIVVFAAGGTCNVTTGQQVRPTVACVANDNGTRYALFGYESASASPVTIPLGASNQIAPASAPSLPTIFQPGSHPRVVSIPLTGASVTWSLGGSTAVANASTPSCGDLGPGEPDLDEDDDPAKYGALNPGVPVLPGGTYVETSSKGVPLAHVDVVEQLADAAEGNDSPEDDPPTLELIHGDRGWRAVEVVVVNNLDVGLSFVDGFAQGAIAQQPPSVIRPGSYGTFETHDAHKFQGTGGLLIWRVGNGPEVVSVDWDNPFLTENTYHANAGDGIQVDIIGGENALATVFFIVRRATQESRPCVPGTMQWIIDNLRRMEPRLTGMQESLGVVSTPLKRSGLGLMAWGETGCLATRVIGTIKQAAWSTDNFYTIDVLLDEFEGALLTGTNKAIRIEVDPHDPRDHDGPNPAHQAIVNGGGLSSTGIVNGGSSQEIVIGRRILFNGVVRVDHGHFLEVHPFEAFMAAPECGSPNEPLFCNPILQNVFTTEAGFENTSSVFMGAAQDRACFLITVNGTMISPAGGVGGGSALADIDETTGEWKLSVRGPALGSLRAQARCIAATGLSPSYRWESRTPPTTMQMLSPTRACYMTGVGGDWTDSKSRVEVHNALNPMVLLGDPGATQDYSGTARCMDIAAFGAFFPYILEPGPTATQVMQPLEYGCFYTQIKGPFGVMPFPVPLPSRGSLVMSVQSVSGVPRWAARVDGTSSGGAIACDILTP